jgi:predicted chitinase
MSTSKAFNLKLQDVITQNIWIPFEDTSYGFLVNNTEFCTEVQDILKTNKLLENVDGIYGPKTREALRKFKASRNLDIRDTLDPVTAKELIKAKTPSAFLSSWKGGDKTATVNAIIQESFRQGITSHTQIAYIIATVQHETGDSFQPVKEAYYLGEQAGENYRKTLRYYPYYGRGYVQLTWDFNYCKYSEMLGLDLIDNPSLVMRPDVSLFILVNGMKRGIFTGIKLDDYICEDYVDFWNARKIINGTDRAALIEKYAIKWQADLRAIAEKE